MSIPTNKGFDLKDINFMHIKNTHQIFISLKTCVVVSKLEDDARETWKIKQSYFYKF